MHSLSTFQFRMVDTGFNHWLKLLVFVIVFLKTECLYVGITYVHNAVAKGAVCLDGSAPAYHWDKGSGTGANNWLVHLEGGGWCNNVTTCLSRKNTRLGSSNKMAKLLPFSGILGNHRSLNPDFYNWNRVKIRYCDGASFTGDVETVNPATKLHFRGARIFRAVIEDLLQKGMKNATNALLSGCSAGGLSSILHCDKFRAFLPMRTKVKCLSDAGFFINVRDVSGAQHIGSFFSEVIALHGSAKNLPRTPISKLRPGLGFFPQYITQQIRTPLFLVNAAYDSWQIRNILAPTAADPRGHWRSCKLDVTNCSPNQIKTMQDFRQQFLTALGHIGTSPSRGLFIDSCYAHCQTEMQETWFRDDSPVLGHRKKVTRRRTPHDVQNKTDSSDIRIECCTDVEKSDELPCVSPSLQLDQWDRGSISDIDSRTNGRSVQVSSRRPRSSSNRFLSRFNLVPRNMSFRLSRTTDLGSSRSFDVSSLDQRVLTDEEELHLRTRQGRGCFEGSQVQLDTQMIPAHPVLRDGHSARLEVDIDSHPPRTQSRMETIETRHSGWTGALEYNDRNVRLSRTLSVGRLRDRVLRHSSLSDLTLSPLRQERETRGAGQVSARHIRHGDTTGPPPGVNNVSSSFSRGYASPSLPSSLVSTQDYQMETVGSTESSYQELMEYRSDFLERGRRIRSQVRALRRLGSRFENLSGHTRSCILSRQHRTGSCTCHIRSHDADINNANTRSSISRIVVLAETLFEVLDEIHQQSVVLSSRPSLSSIGSVPAPNEVVESLPLKSYSKAQKYKTEDTAQCYICLLDYEEGDKLRTLPCQHEFHRGCVDKWLKEMHRVCPVCRGDVCRSNSLPLGM